MILFIEISRAAAAADLGMLGDKATMRGVRASRPRARVGLFGIALGIGGVILRPRDLTRCTARGRGRPRHTSVLAATLFLKCIYRELGAVGY